MCEFRDLMSDTISAFIDSTGKTCAWIAQKAEVGQETVRRALQKEATPNIFNTRAILSAMDIPANRVAEIMNLHPKNGGSYNPKVQNYTANDLVAELMTNSAEAVLINGFTDKKNGTSRKELLEHLPYKLGNTLIESLLNKSILREVNGKLISRRVLIRHPAINQKAVESINSLGQKLSGCDDYKTNFGSFIGTRNKEGAEKANKLCNKFFEELTELMDDPEYAGDEVLFLGLTKVTI